MNIIDREFLEVCTPTCHASTIAFYKNNPVFSWFGGKREGLPDSSIYVQHAGGIKNLGTGKQMAYWNPILFTIEDELFLSYKRGDFCDRWQTYILNISDIDNDFNLVESKAQIIPAGLNFCVKTKPIISSAGFITCGSSVETKDDWTSYIETYEYKDGKFVFDERSKPLTVEKKSYSYEHPWYGEITGLTSGIIQPSVWKDKESRYHAFFRSSRGLGKIYYSTEKNHSWRDGVWSDPEPTKLENPNSGIDTVYMDGRLFLVYNPSEKSRIPLMLSELDEEFNVVDEIIISESILKKEKTATGELSYPYMVENNGKIHLVYTYGRSKIEHVTIEV